MANRYNVEAMKTRTNYMDARVSAPVVLSAWIEQGNPTVGTKNTKFYNGKYLGMPDLTFATEFDMDTVNAGEEQLQLAVDTAYTYEALKGRPILTKPSTTGGVIGVLLEYGNQPYAIPATSGAADSVAKRVTNLYYRAELVKLYGVEYRPVNVDGATGGPIAVGDRLTWDVSAGEWIKDGGATSPVVSCHYSAADSTKVGALFLGGAGVSQA